MTQKERMLAGQLYLVDEELAAENRRTAGVLRQFNSEPEPEARAALLRGLLGGTGTHVHGSSRPSAATTAAISIWAKTSMRIMSSSCSTSATSASATTSSSGRA